MTEGVRGRFTDHFVSLEEDDATALVTCREIVASRIKLDCRDDIGYKREE